MITFPGYTKKYCLNNDELNPISAYFTATTVFDDFEIYGGTLSDEIDPSVPTKTDQTDATISDEVNGDTSDEVNGDISDETDRDKSHQINQKKGFWTTKNIIAIVLSTVAVIISVLIVAIIIRYRQSRHSLEA
ncbi:hypothetical protein RF11_10326 [Thelohanellus kitauei]|uniref:Uncharacterized protein n=1 Tax=Thelohanellus kitauei TaxID=669202 RepID=A0A0C2JM45_THEKT|nr:hypothetical protein RF11_10326 [Thelohanellus kitauei]